MDEFFIENLCLYVYKDELVCGKLKLLFFSGWRKFFLIVCKNDCKKNILDLYKVEEKKLNKDLKIFLKVGLFDKLFVFYILYFLVVMKLFMFKWWILLYFYFNIMYFILSLCIFFCYLNYVFYVV